MLEDILSISGTGGLFKLVAQNRNGIIVESIDEEKKRMPVYTSSKVSALEDIAIFTHDQELKLEEVFKKINEKEEGKPAIDYKSSNEELKSYFEEVLPDYDRDRVYVSDIKKVVRWYNILQSFDMLKFEEEEPEEAEEKTEAETEDNTETGEKEKETGKKASAKSTEAKKETGTKKSSKAPDKKTAEKKTEAEKQDKKPPAKKSAKSSEKAAPKKQETKTSTKKSGSSGTKSSGSAKTTKPKTSGTTGKKTGNKI